MIPRDPPPATAAEAAARALEEDIVLGRLAPGRRLTEDELMARFALTRHAARESLAHAERLGLVERRRHVGAQVRQFGEREVRELYAMRELLEGEAARRMPLPVAPQDLERLEAIQMAHDRAIERGRPLEVFRANLAFHRALFALTGDAVLENAIEEYARQTHAIRFATIGHPDYREQARREHREMLRALAKGDRATLVKAFREHLRPAKQAYLAQIGAPPVARPLSAPAAAKARPPRSRAKR